MHRTLAHFLRIHSRHLWVKYWVSRNNRKVNDLTEVGVSTLEERMAKLERDVESLKRDCSKTGDLVAQKPGWISKVTGTFENAPEFDEILRLGREERKADVLNEE